MRTTFLTVVLALLIAAVPASAATIGFDALLTAAPFSSYSEFGFTVTATSGNWESLTSYGHPAPFIEFQRVTAEPTITAQVAVTAGGSPFTFGAVDLYSSITPIPYVLTGLLNSSTVFTLSGTVPNTFGGFATVTSNGFQAIDTLLITLSNPGTPCCAINPVGLDNIVVNTVPVNAVPEPAALVLFGAGVTAVAARRRGR